MCKTGWIFMLALILANLVSADMQCDSRDQLDEAKRMFPDRIVRDAKQVVSPGPKFRDSGRFECGGNVEDTAVEIFQVEVGSVGEVKYRISYRTGEGSVKTADENLGWLILCDRDKITDDVSCSVRRGTAPFRIHLIPPVRLLQVGGKGRAKGSQIALRVDNLPAHISFQAFVGKEADAIIRELKSGKSVLVRWTEWPDSSPTDEEVTLGPGLPLALELAAWTGERMRVRSGK
jgi:hypothetical protein